jgi:hypothetical protein
VLAFAQVGQIALPPVFGALVGAGLGWGAAWIALGLPAAAIALWLVRLR